MKVEEKKQGEVLILYLSGRLDNPGVYDLTKTVTRVIELGEYSLLMNLENLTYLNSSGLKALLDTEKRIQTKGGRFAVCSAKGLAKRVIGLVGFDKMLAIYDSEEEALQHFS